MVAAVATQTAGSIAYAVVPSIALVAAAELEEDEDEKEAVEEDKGLEPASAPRALAAALPLTAVSSLGFCDGVFG